MIQEVEFEIIEINRERAIRTSKFIKVVVTENGKSLGAFWQSASILDSNILAHGKASYKNLDSYRDELLSIGATSVR